MRKKSDLTKFKEIVKEVDKLIFGYKKPKKRTTKKRRTVRGNKRKNS